jgi:hypothetical protein
MTSEVTGSLAVPSIVNFPAAMAALQLVEEVAKKYRVSSQPVY